MKIKIVIPAMEWRKLSRVHRAYTTSLYIGGYVANPHKQTNDSGRKYKAWKAHCKDYLQATLFTAGIYNGEPRDEIGWKVTVEPYFYNKVHVDGTNVLKGIEDSLVYKEKGKGTFFFKDDKNLAGEYTAPRYDKMNPRVEVTIERVER